MNFQKIRELTDVSKWVSAWPEFVPTESLVRICVRLGLKRDFACIFPPQVVLCAMILQRLQRGTLEDAVENVAHGCLDELVEAEEPPSMRIRTLNTGAYSKARGNLPPEFFREALHEQVDRILNAAVPKKCENVFLLDGTTITLRPNGNIPKNYDSAGNQYGESYWRKVRVTVSLHLNSGILTGVEEGPESESEQSQAWRIFSRATPGSIFVGDGNFGIYSVSQAAIAHQCHTVVRMSGPRVKRLLKGRMLRRGEEIEIEWKPTRYDKTSPDLNRESVRGRLLKLELTIKGKKVSLHVFTTLSSDDFSKEEIAELMRRRWEVEVNLRYVKTNLDMKELKVNSAEMAQRELYAGAMAYNLVRSLMRDAEESDEGRKTKEGKTDRPTELSFSSCGREIVRFLLGNHGTRECLLWRLRVKRLASPRKPKPAEPRKIRRKAYRYPGFRGSREAARKAFC